MLQLMCFPASVRHFCLSLNSCTVLLLYHTRYFVSYYFSDLNSELFIIRYCRSTTFLICTAVRSIHEVLVVLRSIFFLISILNSVLLYCFSDLNSLTPLFMGAESCEKSESLLTFLATFLMYALYGSKKLRKKFGNFHFRQ